MEINGTNIKQKISKKYCCEICNYNTDRKSNIENHFNSAKHLKEQSGTEIKQKLSKHYECKICNKIYQTPSGLWKHKQSCINEDKVVSEITDLSETNEVQDLKEIMKYLMKENSEMKHMMMDVIKNGINNNNNNTINTNSHNKTFNLQFFLNETCKDAMNIMDFVDSIKLQLSDLERVGKIGYVEGISNIIVKNLNSLEESKRPVHCTDSKREVMYVKDQDKWEKENENKQKLRKAIKHVAYKNSKLLHEFIEKYPDCGKSISKYSDQYNKLVVEAFGGKGDNDLEKEDKIIKNIAKEVIIIKD
jgi:hypothetical protein